MPISKKNKLGWVVGSYVLCVAAWASAPAPISYDSYTVANGVITPNPLPLGATALAASVVTDDGFYQRQVKIGAQTYIQFILTDQGVSGNALAAPFSTARGSLNFTNEDFIRMGNRGEGLASKQTIIESTPLPGSLEDRFININQFAFGWANTAPEPWVNVHQYIGTVDYNPLLPEEIFANTADILSSNTSFTSDQSIDLSQYINLGGAGTTDNIQKYHYNEASGLYQYTCHPGPCAPFPLAVPYAQNGTLLPGGTPGDLGVGNFSWLGGNKLAAMWVGQSGPGDYGTIGFTHYQQSGADDAALPGKETQLLSLADPNPVNYYFPPFLPLGGPLSINDPPGSHNVSPTDFSIAAPSAPTGNFPGPPATILPGSSTPLGPPVAFGGWTVATGTITPSGSGVSLVTGSGLLQRYIDIGGDRYIQTIVTDATATGNPNNAPFTAGALGYSNESFVKMGVTDPAQQGVSANLHIESQNMAYQSTPVTTDLPFNGGQFTYTATNNTGWANGSPNAPTLQVHEHVYVPQNNPLVATSMDEVFDMKTAGSSTNNRDIHITQAAGSEAQGDTFLFTIGLIPLFTPAYCTGTVGGVVVGPNCVFAGTGFVNPDRFETRILNGTLNTTAHSSFTDPTLLNAGATNSGNISWVAGEGIQATWVGALYNTSAIPTGQQTTSTTRFTNLNTGESTKLDNQITPQPLVTTAGYTYSSWDEYFGTPPAPQPNATPVWSTPFVPGPP